VAWYRKGVSWDSNDQKSDSISLFADFDLLIWLFGIKFDIDPSWIDFSASIGPLSFSVIYWRKYERPQIV
jgi:hypothetical protein